jgi:tRNA(Ile)-lysidine synthetase-like protein
MDHVIKMMYGDTLLAAERGDLDHWVSDPDSYLALIILLDQFTRNLTRNGDYRKNDAKAYDLVSDLISSGKAESYPIHQRIFIYLPLRHQRTTPLLNQTLDAIRLWETTYLSPTEANIVRRFKLATLRDYGRVTDTIICSTDYTDKFNNVDFVVDEECSKYPEITSGLSSIKSDITIDAIYSSSVYATTLKFIRHNFGDNAIICISLSGGVDSMVISILLMVMKLKGDIKDVVAVHVDYANRKVSNDEATFTINWSQFLGISIYYRRIEHIHRGSGEIDAEFYESETKKIRFNLYHYVMKKCGVMGVILGHHGDDTDENVLMNLLRGNDILNLNGMKEIENIDGVNICRPLLPHPKSDIYDLAHSLQVPYLKDTTSDFHLLRM